MIEAKDLRIGDMVRFEDGTCHVLGVVKDYKGSYSCYIEADDFGVTELLEPKYVDPIPPHSRNPREERL